MNQPQSEFTKLRSNLGLRSRGGVPLPPELRQLIFNYLPLPVTWRWQWPNQFWSNRAAARYHNIPPWLLDSPSVSTYLSTVINASLPNSGDTGAGQLEIAQLGDAVVDQLGLMAQSHAGPLEFYTVTFEGGRRDPVRTDSVFSGTSLYQVILKVRDYILAHYSGYPDIIRANVIRRLYNTIIDMHVSDIAEDIARDMTSSDPVYSAVILTPVH